MMNEKEQTQTENEYEMATPKRPYNYLLLVLCEVALRDYNPEEDSISSENAEATNDHQPNELTNNQSPETGFSDEEDTDNDDSSNDESVSESEHFTDESDSNWQPIEEVTPKRRRLHINPQVYSSDEQVAPIIKRKKITPISQSQSPDYVVIGSGGNKVPRDAYEKINWKNYRIATRKLMNLLFTKKTMATSSLTGKKSPAFLHKKCKPQLNPIIVGDIVECIEKNCEVDRQRIRNVFTTKCADENKILRRLQIDKGK
ncbi:protein insensitive-like [Aethina tumida]|uniref:protein insensitive-like n=1 Tax=Aethina tumida TaxID=116153 RepID=UPI002148D85F|nr:protein insensitive-like [Aethina tumida]